MIRFCDKLQTLRQSMGLTQDEFSDRIGVSRQLVSKWESGTAYPDLNNLQSICLFFSVSADGLLNPNTDAVRLTEEEVLFDVSSLGDNLKRIRSAKGIAQEVFADMLQVSRQSVSKWENGTVIPKTEVMLQMLPILEISISDLLPCAKENAPTVEAVAASEEEPTEVDAPVGEPVEVNVPAPEIPVATKKRRRTLRRVCSISAVAVCLVLAILLTTFYVNRPTEIQMPDEALLARAKKDYFYLDKISPQEYDPETSVTVHCIGLFGESIVGYFDDGRLYLATSTREKVAGYTIRYATSQHILVWKDGEFYSLTKAYAKGFLTKKDIQTIAEQVNAKKTGGTDNK